MKTFRAFTLLEVMLALAIFSMAILGLALSLQEMIEASLESRRDNEVRRELDSRLATFRQKQIQPGTQDLGQDQAGRTYEGETTLLELKNQRNVALHGLYRLTVRTKWKAGATEEERSCSLYVYQP
jgi:prepilin-type N-terminal cleavage/methylation domain-containing protein